MARVIPGVTRQTNLCQHGDAPRDFPIPGFPHLDRSRASGPDEGGELDLGQAETLANVAELGGGHGFAEIKTAAALGEHQWDVALAQAASAVSASLV